MQQQTVESPTGEDGIGIKCTLTFQRDGSDPVQTEIRVIGVDQLPTTEFVVDCNCPDDLRTIEVVGGKFALIKTGTPGTWRASRDWRTMVPLHRRRNW